MDLPPPAMHEFAEQGKLNGLCLSGTLAMQTGQWEQALEQYSAALTVARSLNAVDRLASIHEALATIYTSLHLPRDAQLELLLAARAYKHLGNLPGQAKAFTALANSARDKQHRRTYLARALCVARHTRDRRLRVNLLKAAASVHALDGEYGSAVRYTEQALVWDRRSHQPDQIAQDWINLAEFEENRGNDARAYWAYRRAARWYHCLQVPSGEISAHLGAARLDIKHSDFVGATEKLGRALALQTATDLHDANSVTLFAGLAYVAERLGNIDQASRYLKAAANGLEAMRADFALPDLAIEFVGSRAALYARVVSLLWQQRHSAEALKWTEHIRSRALLNMLAYTPMAFSMPSADEKQAATENEWLDKIRLLLGKTHTTRPDTETLQRLRQASSKLESIWNQCSDQEYVALRRGEPMSYLQVRGLLSEA